MKKLALVLLLSLPLLAQTLTSGQIKVKTDGGVTGDTSGAIALTFYRATTAPASPTTGQLWCDTSYSPCVFKHYNGSSWVAPITSTALVTQTDASTFPANPSDGQMFFSKNNPTYALFIYDATLGSWVGMSGMGPAYAASAIRDVYSAAVIAAPGSAPTATRAAGGGSIANGTFTYKVTFYNSTGGETTPSPYSNIVTTTGGGTDSVNLTSIPTGGSGTTGRRIYRTKTATTTWGPWFYVGIIADNSTTTFTDTLADASLVYFAPDVNYSGAVPGAWTVVNTSSNTNVGGCGTTSRNTMACYGPAMQYGNNYTTAPTTDARVEGVLDVSSYTAGDFTVQYRIRRLSPQGDNYGYGYGQCYVGMRKNTADNDIRFYMCWQGQSANSVQVNLQGGSRSAGGYTERTVAAGGATNSGGLRDVWPAPTNFPIHVRIIKRGSQINVQESGEGQIWTNKWPCIDNNTSQAQCSITAATTAVNRVVLPVGLFGAGVNIGTQTQFWIEIDNFTLTVN